MSSRYSHATEGSPVTGLKAIVTSGPRTPKPPAPSCTTSWSHVDPSQWSHVTSEYRRSPTTMLGYDVSGSKARATLVAPPASPPPGSSVTHFFLDVEEYVQRTAIVPSPRSVPQALAIRAFPL